MKPILKSQDLAVTGAPPAFEHTLHAGRPSIGSREVFLDDVAAVIRVLVNG